MNPNEEDLSDVTIIERFEALFDKTIKIIDDTNQNTVLVE